MTSEGEEDDPAKAAFLQAFDNVSEAIKDLPDRDACLALTLVLANRIVRGNPDSEDGTAPMSLLAQSIKVLGDVVRRHVDGDDDDDDVDGDGDNEEQPPRPSAALLTRLELRRLRERG
jgi:hypothetical protein